MQSDRTEAPVGALDIATIRDGRIVRGEVVYDGEAMRRAMAEAAAQA